MRRLAGFSTVLYDAWADRNRVSGDEREKNRDRLRTAAMLQERARAAQELAQLELLGDEAGGGGGGISKGGGGGGASGKKAGKGGKKKK